MSRVQKRVLMVMGLVMILVIGLIVLWAVQREDARRIKAGQDMAAIYSGTVSP